MFWPPRFRLINMRQSFGFKFIKHGFESPVIVAVSGPISNKVTGFPTSGHLAVDNDPK